MPSRSSTRKSLSQRVPVGVHLGSCITQSVRKSFQYSPWWPPCILGRHDRDDPSHRYRIEVVWNKSASVVTNNTLGNPARYIGFIKGLMMLASFSHPLLIALNLPVYPAVQRQAQLWVSTSALDVSSSFRFRIVSTPLSATPHRSYTVPVVHNCPDSLSRCCSYPCTCHPFWPRYNRPRRRGKRWLFRRQ